MSIISWHIDPMKRNLLFMYFNSSNTTSGRPINKSDSLFSFSNELDWSTRTNGYTLRISKCSYVRQYWFEYPRDVWTTCLDDKCRSGFLKERGRCFVFLEFFGAREGVRVVNG